MKVKWNKKVILLLVASVSALVLVAATQTAQVRNRFKREFEPGTLPHRARELKEKGITRPQVRPHIVNYGFAKDYDGVLASSDLVVLATMVDQRYRFSMDLTSIRTVAKFRIDEVLSGDFAALHRRIPVDRMPPGMKSLGPLDNNEILVGRNGGTLMIEGILFRDTVHNFPSFIQGRQYVLFLKAPRFGPEHRRHYGDEEVQAKTFGTVAGHQGCLIVEEDGILPLKVKPVASQGFYQARKELERRFGSRKDFFVDYLRRLGR